MRTIVINGKWTISYRPHGEGKTGTGTYSCYMITAITPNRLKMGVMVDAPGYRKLKLRSRMR